MKNQLIQSEKGTHSVSIEIKNEIHTTYKLISDDKIRISTKIKPAEE